MGSLQLTTTSETARTAPLDGRRPDRLGTLTAVLAVLVFSFAGCSTDRADWRARESQQLFAKWDTARSPGCAVAVLRNDSILFQGGYGSAELKSRRSIGDATAFGLASMSKQFTAAAVGMLVLDGKLSLNDDVRKHIPELPSYGHPLLLRDLIYHTSGLRDYISLTEDLSDYATSGQPSGDRGTLALLARQKALNFQPGTQFSYSNSNYFLLSIVVKRATGVSLGQFAHDRIFRPLGMKNTFFRDNPPENPADRAIAYETSEGQRFAAVKPSKSNGLVGDAGVVTTLSDLVLWDREFYRSSLGGRPLHDLLSTRGKLRDGTSLTYAFGLYVEDSPAGPKIYHGGNGDGFRTRFVRYPNQHSSIICLCNLSDVPTSQLVDRLTAIYLGQEQRPTTRMPSPEELRRVEGFYRDSSTMGIWSFKADGTRLVATLLGIPGERTLVATESQEFATADGSFNARFDAPAQAVEIREYGRPGTNFVRVQLSPPGNLGDYAGRYDRDELDQTYEIAVVDGRLAVLSPKAAATKLSPTVTDSFTGFGNYFFFQRKDGAVTGLILGENTGRVRNLALKRDLDK
jgi:CubicO group peptidase (beta-lactamase class C family)